MRGAATVILVIVVFIMIGMAVVFFLGFMAKAHGAILPLPSPSTTDANTTLPNQSGNLAPAICCGQYGEGKEWGDTRK